MIRIRVDNKRFLYQVILFVLMSNLVVYMMTTKIEDPIQPKVPSNYLEIIVKLRLFVPFERYKKVTLYLPQHNIYISDIYLLKDPKLSPLAAGSNKNYIVKASPENLKKILAYKSSLFEVYPEETKLIRLSKKRRTKYEILY